MMDSQELNPIAEGSVEEVKKAVEPEVENVETSDAPVEEAQPATEDTAEEAQPVTEDAVEEAQPVTEDAAEEAQPATEDTAEEAQPVTEDAVEEAQPVTEDAAEEAQPATEDTAEEAQPVTEDAVEEVQPAAEEASVEVAEETKTAPERKTYTSKKEVLDRVKEIAHSDEPFEKEEVDYLKTSFYRILNAEREADMKEFIDKGGEPNAYSVLADNDEEAFKAEMGVIRERRQKIARELEAEKENNLQRKLAIIEKIKSMITSPEEANKSYGEFKKLQQEWKEIKSVPAPKANELWRNYQLYAEQFYDLLKLNSAAREYDFKKNLELKLKLCEAAERLADETDVISAFHQLQKLHQEFREVGPVSKDLREQVWTRFKAASTVINKRHQQHFDDLRSKEMENLEKKTALCEKVEAIVAEENKGSGDWDRHTKQIIEIQTEWKAIGFAPQKMNVKIFERFRRSCDDFFGRKAEYFRTIKEQFKQNAEKKRALIEQAKEMKTSTDWKATSEKFVALQKEWRTIGTVPKKLGDQLWNEFLSNCNEFFEARNAANAGQNTEYGNLSKKKEIIAKLKEILAGDNADVQDEVQQLADEYVTIGHVPFKEKDKIFEEYHAVLDELTKRFDISVTKRHQTGKGKGKGLQGQTSQPETERTKLLRQYESLKADIQTYENNIGFLNASSKKGNKLIDDLNKKMDKLKADLAAVKDKITKIDSED